MEAAILDGLKKIVGEKNVGTDLGRYLKSGDKAPGLTAVSPGSTEEVQAIVNLARERRIPIITIYDRFLSAEDLDKQGIFLEFSRMNKIERIDHLNLIAHFERGVTWDALIAELKKLGIKTVMPVAAGSPFPAECAAVRAVSKAVAKFPDYPMTNMKVVLGYGNIIKTGTHSLNEEASDGRCEGGPNLSNWYTASDDIFGVMTRVSLSLWPICECRASLVFAFEDREELLAVMRNLPRTELGVEYVALNAAALKRLLGNENRKFAPWTLTVGFEGRKVLVDHNMARVRELAAKYKCKPEDDLCAAMAEQLEKSWPEASCNHTAFFTLFPRLKGFDAHVSKAAEKAGVPETEQGKILVSFDRGRAVYAVYDWLTDKDLTEAVEQLNLHLAEHGAYFDRPLGKLGRKVLGSIPNHLPVIKHIKSYLDPQNIMNPSRIVKPEDKEWQPLKVREGEVGLTVANLREVKEKLAEKLGALWVSDNPADLNCYSRDFTIFSGERPNLVALPETIEDVQHIIRVAYEHGIPLVPLSTGFNHGGLTVTRKGGIIVDLKRMKAVCEFDPESMTATLSPGVRMRSVWWEAVKHKVTDGYHMKPILPLTFGSVSLLSNYVSRGAAGTAFKYGNNSELTINMTWVLPNGEVFKIGPSALPKVGDVPIHYCPGPELNGMLFNADGLFGICTQITVKLYPEKDNINELETMITAANMDGTPHEIFSETLEAIRDLAHENITDFMYKAHPGLFALAVTTHIEGAAIEDVITAGPVHPLGIIISGFDKEEVQIKSEIIGAAVEKHGLFLIDPASFGPELAEMATTDISRMSLGMKENFAGGFKGAFQWTAGFLKFERIPALAKEYDLLVKKYWKTSDPKISVEHAMTGTDVQGPLPYGRIAGVEFDFWWDQGNPEDVKRATQMLHKTQKLMIKHGSALWRNMFGAGEYHLPHWGEYFQVLKKTRKAFDPANLMHPDVLPVTDDFV